jgi:replicative DNA helicase
VLASASGVGKTQWALQVALRAAQDNQALAIEIARAQGVASVEPRPVVYVALELGPIDMVARTISLLAAEAGARVPWSNIAMGKLSESELVTLAGKHEDALRTLPLHVEVAPPHGWDVSNLTRIAKMNPSLVVIDFMQLIGARKGSDAREAMSQTAYAARAVARDHQCVVLALSSTARTNYSLATGADERDRGKTADPAGKGDPARFIGLGKESGDIEFACDGVLAMLQEAYDEKKPRERPTHIAIAKQRGGSTGWVKLSFDGSRFREPERGSFET